MMHKTVSIIFLLLLLALALGCASKDGAVATDPVAPEARAGDDSDARPVAEAPPAPRRYLLGPGDKLSVQVYRREDLSGEMPVRDDGNIFVPLAGTVRAEGLTIGELTTLLTLRLSEYVRVPQVSVVLLEAHARSFYLLGEVNEPGSYSLEPDIRLLEAIASGKGLTKEANLSDAYLVQNKQVVPIDFYALFKKGDVSQNVFLEDGAFIYIPSRELMRVFVLGEVKQPGVIQITEGRLSLSEAIASAGGFDEITAFKSNIKIIRGGLADPEVITVNYDWVLRGKAKDEVVLETGDIVFVPASGVAKWDRILGQLLPNLSRIIVDAAAIRAFGN